MSKSLGRLKISNEVFKKICEEHIKVNQWYEDDDNFFTPVPYELHLRAVAMTGERFLKLLDNNPNKEIGDITVASYGLCGHDLIEDARLTYNNIIDLFRPYVSSESAKKIAEVIFLVSDYRGRNREERKPKEYYEELRENDIAIFVKLSDLIANMTYGKLMNSSMYVKYKNIDLPKLEEYCGKEWLAPMFEYAKTI